MKRYEIIIKFKSSSTPLIERVKTMRIANGFKGILDDTVLKATVTDRVTKKTTVWLTNE